MSFWQHLVLAIGLVLLIEGLIPFLKPELWRKSMLFLVSHTDGFLRKMGLIAIVLGTIIILVIQNTLTNL